MHPGSPELTVAIALAVGVIAQIAAHHMRVPGIVVLLVTGVLLGPDVAAVIDPSSLGHALTALVGFAVAIVLFEGGLALNITRLVRAGPAVRNLLTVGPTITAACGAVAAKYLLGWPWKSAVLFSTLVVVTGPTVVTPLLRRLRVERQVSAVLEIEGVLIDAIGAIVAVVALDVAISGEGPHVASGALEVFVRLGVGSVVGLVGGGVIALLLRSTHLIPSGLENVLTLGLVVALFFACDEILPESGLAAVTIAGVVVANVRTHIQRELREFKEQLTVMLIGMLFVLLAADVRMAEVLALGWPGLAVVAVLVFVARPLNALISTAGTGLSWKQRVFIGWIAPRGIVAAAVASHFALELSHLGIEGGSDLRALVFLTIAVTVTLAGLTGGPLANLLGLRLKDGEGWIILGAHELSRAMAHELSSRGDEVILVDTNPDHCRIATEEGLQAVNANALEDVTLHAMQVETRRGVIGFAPNEEVNLRFAEASRHECSEIASLVALSTSEETVSAGQVHALGGEVLFGRDRDLDTWTVLLRHGVAVIEEWELGEGAPDEDTFRAPGRETEALLPIVVDRDGVLTPATESVRYKDGDRVTFLVNARMRVEAKDWLTWWGWRRVESSEAKHETWKDRVVKAKTDRAENAARPGNSGALRRPAARPSED